VTGEMDPATAEAVRRYQADHGLDSPMLSLAATRQLGISTTALDQLQ
jgi:peptidoglycan hydrolase-like protein with peptidoglycan-binding domain